MHFFYQSCHREPSLNPIQVPLNSRAFLFGDHVYEVIRTYNHKPFAVEEHFDRMLSSLDYLKYAIFPSLDTLYSDLEVITDFAYKSLKLTDELYIRVHFGRDSDKSVSLKPDPSFKPIWAYICAPLQQYAQQNEDGRGIRFGISPLFRHLYSCFSPNAKTGNYLNNMIGCIDAKERGFDDAVFLNAIDQSICEASTSNIAFMDEKGEMIFIDPTPQPSYLMGITQSLLTQSSNQPHFPWRYEKVTLERAKSFPYAFAISTLREIQWVESIGELQFQHPTHDILSRLNTVFYDIVKHRSTQTQKRTLTQNL